MRQQHKNITGQILIYNEILSNKPNNSQNKAIDYRGKDYKQSFQKSVFFYLSPNERKHQVLKLECFAILN